MQEVDQGYKARMLNSRRLAESVQLMMTDIVVARNASCRRSGDASECELVIDLSSDEDDIISVSSMDDLSEVASDIVDISDDDDEEDG